jgi:hypothetical protein
MGLDAFDPSRVAAANGHIDALAARCAKLVQVRGRAVGEHGAWTAGEYRGHIAAPAGQERRRGYRVDGAVDAVQPSALGSLAHGRRTEPNGLQLRERSHTLPFRNQVV